MSIISLLKSPDAKLYETLEKPFRRIKFIGGKTVYFPKAHMKPGKNGKTFLQFLLSENN